MQIVPIRDKMHDMSKPAVWEKYEKYYNMTSADKILPRVLRVKQIPFNVLFKSFTTTYREKICKQCRPWWDGFCQIFLSNNSFWHNIWMAFTCVWPLCYWKSNQLSGVCNQKVYDYNKLALLLRCSGKPHIQRTASWSKIPGLNCRPG